jgi:hypothetical protein
MSSLTVSTEVKAWYIVPLCALNIYCAARVSFMYRSIRNPQLLEHVNDDANQFIGDPQKERRRLFFACADNRPNDIMVMFISVYGMLSILMIYFVLWPHIHPLDRQCVDLETRRVVSMRWTVPQCLVNDILSCFFIGVLNALMALYLLSVSAWQPSRRAALLVALGYATSTTLWYEFTDGLHIRAAASGFGCKLDHVPRYAAVTFWIIVIGEYFIICAFGLYSHWRLRKRLRAHENEARVVHIRLGPQVAVYVITFLYWAINVSIELDNDALINLVWAAHGFIAAVCWCFGEGTLRALVLPCWWSIAALPGYEEPFSAISDNVRRWDNQRTRLVPGSLETTLEESVGEVV